MAKTERGKMKNNNCFLRKRQKIYGGNNEGINLKLLVRATARRCVRKVRAFSPEFSQ